MDQIFVFMAIKMNCSITVIDDKYGFYRKLDTAIDFIKFHKV